MTAALTFNLPEESEEHQVAADGWKWKTCVADLDQVFRDKLKYGHDFKTPDEVLEFARHAIYDVTSQSGLTVR